MTIPNFDNAKNRRQKVRAAGMDPNYWYAVAQDSQVKRNQVMEVKFWGSSVALYRGESGKLHAIEDRCAHRQIPLHIGVVKGERLVCDYHGWEYDADGKLSKIPHELFGHKMPNCKLKSFAVRERYGLIWVFFGDQENAEKVTMPSAPELEGPNPWACVPIEFTWKAHHSMIIDNVSDFTHEYLHRRFKPFTDAKLTRLESVGDRVDLAYQTKVGGGKITSLFMDKQSVDMDHMELSYEYPYQRSNTDNNIKHWCMVLPIDERTTKVFFLFYFKSFKVPFLPLKFPKRVMDPIIKIANIVHIKPLLSEDGLACALEQTGYEDHYDEPIAELSPAVHAFQALTIRKWEEYLAREAEKTGKSTALIDPAKLKRISTSAQQGNTNQANTNQDSAGSADSAAAE